MRITHSFVVTSLLALAATAASAQEATPDYPTAFTSTVSRAEVVAQLVLARAGGHIAQGEASFEMAEKVASVTTRAEVRAEAIEARRLGLIVQGDAQVREAAASELELVRLAGLRARNAQVMLSTK